MVSNTLNQYKLNLTINGIIHENVSLINNNSTKVIIGVVGLDDGKIERSEKVRNLSITIDTHLDMKSHFSDNCRLCYYYYGWIK